MGATPTTTNEAIVFFDGLSQAMITGGENLAKAYILTTPAAWLEGPILDVFTNWILSGLANAVYQQSKDVIAKVVINIQTDLEKSQIADAVTSLVAANATGGASEIAAANVQYDNAIASLVHADGIGPST